MSKVLKIVAITFYLATLFLSLSFPTHNLIYIFLLLFAIFFWQKEKIRLILLRQKIVKNRLFIFLLIGLLWATSLSISLVEMPFDPNPLVNTLISFGFYLPYFLLWYLILTKGVFSSLVVFYLAGASGVLFDLLITQKTAQALTQQGLTSPGLFLLTLISRLIVVFTLYGTLTLLPFSLTFSLPKAKSGKVSAYLLALFAPIISLPFFLAWLKTIGF